MNKNPKRYSKIDKAISKIANPKYKTERQKAKDKSKKVLQELTEMGVFR